MSFNKVAELCNILEIYKKDISTQMASTRSLKIDSKH